MARRWGPAIAVTLILVGTLLYGLTSWSSVEPPAASPSAVVWNDRVFASSAELSQWLRSRGSTYRAWAEHHPAAQAILEHRPPPAGVSAPREVAQPSTSPSRSRGHVSLFSGLWLLTCLALGAGLVLAEQRGTEPPSHGLKSERLKAIRRLTEDAVS